jgi:AcrR family transcriptional regulator
MTLSSKRDESIRSILDAAKEVFVSAGFAGARIDEIAKRAGVNKAMIYYRIGDKQTLYAQVLHEIFGDMAKRVEEKIKAHQSPEEKLRLYIRDILSIVEKHPYVPRFMMWELASGGESFPEVAVQDLAQLITLLAKILQEGVEKEVFLGINPFIVQMMVVGTMAFYQASQPIRTKYHTMHQAISDLNIRSSETLAQEIEELVVKAVRR